MNVVDAASQNTSNKNITYLFAPYNVLTRKNFGLFEATTIDLVLNFNQKLQASQDRRNRESYSLFDLLVRWRSECVLSRRFCKSSSMYIFT